MSIQRVRQYLCAWTVLCGTVYGQSTTSGNILGTVTDPSNAAIADAEVQIKETATGAVRLAATGTEGIFRLNNLAPGRYTLTITAKGFKTYTQQQIALNANDNRDLGRLMLAIGLTSEEVTVRAIVTPVQTASSEVSSTITSNQLEKIAIKGRDPIVMLALIPGVRIGNINTTTFSGGGFNADSTSEDGLRQISINGAPSGKANFLVDGIVDMDSGSYQTTHYEPNMDAIEEIKIMTSNFQAEFGRGSGGSVTVITKSGTTQFHGTAQATKRHEMFNAKNFFDNFNNQQKPIYRYFIGTYSVGGPLYIPKVFNRDKSKVFFFWSQEYTRQHANSSYTYAQTPTALERTGDFSQSLDSTGKLIPLFDRSSGTPVPIPGNIIPKTSGNAYGLAMMNFLPLPNRCGASGAASDCWTEFDSTQVNRRNYRNPYTEAHPRRNDVVRIDTRPTGKMSVWWRYVNDYDLQQTNFGVALQNSANQWVPYSEDHPNPGHGHGVGITYTVRPNLVNEFSYGQSYNSWDYYPHDPSQLDRNRMNNPPHWFSENDPNFKNDGALVRPGLAPGAQNFAFWAPAVNGSVTYPNQGTRPYTNWNNEYTANETISYVRGRHNFKAGINFERSQKVQNAGSGTYLGSYNFSGGVLDTGYALANMFLGNFNSYSEGQRVMGDYWFSGIEAFIQDNWRIAPRLTLDLGVRFYHLAPQENTDYTTSTFLQSAYNPAKAPRIYMDGCTVAVPATSGCPTASQVAIDPLTGKTTFPALVNTFVPNSGDYFNGMVIAGQDPRVPLSVFTVPALSPTPRIGLAWDVFGNGKTAIRTGFGIFLQRGDGNQIMDTSGQAPITVNRTVYYSNINQVPSLTSVAAVTPIAPPYLIGPAKYESSYNTSFGIQQAVGFSTVLDVSYVGAFRRHGMQTRNPNPIPMFSQYDPQYQDPWSTNNPKRSINDNFLRPLFGMGNIGYRMFDGSSNYNSLQVSVRKNLSHGLSYSLAYTFAKTMGASPSPYFPDKYRNYGPSSNIPHTVDISYVYEVPNIGRMYAEKVKPVGWVTDHWTVSGITTWTGRWMQGVPGVGFTGSTSANPTPVQTGSAEGARSIMLGNPSVASGDVTWNLSDWTKNNTFNWQAMTIPFPCSWTPQATPQQGVGKSMECFGNAGPGNIMSVPLHLNNFDMTFAKAFPLKNEKRQLIFRAEMYNIFNHTQFSSLNTSIQYDFPSWQKGIISQTNNQLGRYTGARDPRRMAMTVRFTF